jgi:hypothetical protein
MDGEAARLAASESGDERVQSLVMSDRKYPEMGKIILPISTKRGRIVEPLVPSAYASAFAAANAARMVA